MKDFPSLNTTAPTPDAAQPPRRRPQFGLLTLLLLVTAVASWTAFWQTRREMARLEARLPGMREIARPLRVDDPLQYAVVRHHELWNDDFRWRVYLPPNDRYRLRLATKEVDQQGLAEAVDQIELPPGEHELELRHEQVDQEWRIAVLVDGEERLRDAQPSEWNTGRGSSGGSAFATSKQQPVVQPLVLFRRRFMVPAGSSGASGSAASGSATTPQGPSDGILVWIESNNSMQPGVP